MMLFRGSLIVTNLGMYDTKLDTISSLNNFSGEMRVAVWSLTFINLSNLSFSYFLAPMHNFYRKIQTSMLAHYRTFSTISEN